MKAVSTASSLAAVLLSSIARSCDAQDNSTTNATMCSCSPTEMTFVISLDQTCDDNDISLNTGVGGSFCFTETDVALPAPPVVNATNATNATVPEPVRSLQTASDPVVEVVSVQFLEFDTAGDLNVINQDNTYAAVSLVSGDRMTFSSASSFLDTSLPLESQMSGPALVPGGASLILYGKTASGIIVRNRFFWTYDTANCGTDNTPVKVDDEIGWVTVAEVSNAWPVFCPALAPGSPTIAPKSNEPTLTPSNAPVSMSMDFGDGWGSSSSTTGGGSSDGGATQPPTVHASQVSLGWSEDGSGELDAPVFAGKGGKLESKTYKPHSKSGKSKSGKSGSKHDLQGKTGKDDDWWGGAWAAGKVVGYDVTRNDARVSGLYGWGSVAAMVVSVMAGAMLMARQ